MPARSREIPFAKKSLGQNFLADPNFVRKIVESLGDLRGTTVVEIGPGRGALTRRLLDAGANVSAIELDADLIPVLETEFGADDRFRLVRGDALEVDFAAVAGSGPAKLAANLPYYISTAILRRLIDFRESFGSVTVMLQREVVDRITAPPGHSGRGFLTVLVEAYFDVERLFDVPPTAFRPVPKVWSSVVRMIPTSRPRDAGFERLASAGFRQKRKTLANNLKNLEDRDWAGILAACGIDPRVRAESLGLGEWLILAGEAY